MYKRRVKLSRCISHTLNAKMHLNLQRYGIGVNHMLACQLAFASLLLPVDIMQRGDQMT